MRTAALVLLTGLAGWTGWGDARHPAKAATAVPQPVVLAPRRVETVNGAQLTFERPGEAHLQMASAEWNCGLRFLPESGETFDLSGARYLAIDVENLSCERQLRLTLHASAGGGAVESGDHASAIFTQRRSINTGIGLNPGEKGTMKLLLPHPEIYAAPDNARGLYVIDTRHVGPIELKVQWPYERQFRYVVDCRLSNLRLEGTPNVKRRVPAEGYCPFVDKYGQFKHGDWPFKVTDDAAFADDLKRENAALKAAPGSWDRFGGWKDGPRLKPTGHFRTVKAGGKWWLVTPEGHLFFSLGLDVVRTETDVADGSRHPDWYESYDATHPRMNFTGRNLERKFGKADYADDYYDLILRRFDAWGLNTIGNWSAGELTMKGRKPYVISVLENAKGVEMIKANGVRFYDTGQPGFAEKFKAAVRARFAAEPALRQAATDPMCIGFFIDNELKFPGDRTKYEIYFRVCREILDELAPGKLYLGCRFIGFRQPQDLWATAAKYCDIVTVNAYANSIANIPDDIYARAESEKPILVGEFHFGCFDRGMFKAGLCPVWNQDERARAFTRFVQGALCHPLMVGCHWFQYRDQPLLGRGDGEAYEIGFVDVCDRPYPQLCRAARQVGTHMYDYRRRGKLADEMAVARAALPASLPPHPRLWDVAAADDATVAELRRRAAEVRAQPPLDYRLEGRRLLSTARAAVHRLLALAFVYLHDRDEAAAARAVAELSAICNFPDWNTAHFLDTAELAFAVGLAYDALYDRLDRDAKTAIEQALETKALDPALTPCRHTWWWRARGNWNQVCHGGIGVAALAAAEAFPEKAERFIGAAAADLPAALSVYRPNGAYPEGPAYREVGRRSRTGTV